MAVVPTSVRYQEIFRRDTISPYQSSKFGIWIRHTLDISYLVISHDMGYDISIYRDIQCDVTADHPETKANVAVYCFFWLFVSALFLACLSSVPLFLSSFCCPSAGHIIRLTAPPAKKPSNLVYSGLGLLPERMYVFISFICVFSLNVFLSLSFLPSWYT